MFTERDMRVVVVSVDVLVCNVCVVGSGLTGRVEAASRVASRKGILLYKNRRTGKSKLKQIQRNSCTCKVGSQRLFKYQPRVSSRGSFYCVACRHRAASCPLCVCQVPLPQLPRCLSGQSRRELAPGFPNRASPSAQLPPKTPTILLPGAGK